MPGKPLRFMQLAAAKKAARIRDDVKRGHAMNTPVTEPDTLSWLLDTHRDVLWYEKPLENPTYRDIVRVIEAATRRMRQ